MRIWLALIVTPLLALADQIVAFALVHWACAHQGVVMVHVSHVLFLAGTVVATVVAWKSWRETALIPVRNGDTTAQQHFLAGVATAIGTLSAATIVAMWIPTWMISSCLA